MDNIIGENVTFRIEVEDKPRSVLLVFDRSCDSCVVPYEDAEHLAETIERVIEDVRRDFRPTAPFVTFREQARVKLGHKDGLVGIFIEWTDRIRFTSLDAFYLLARALRQAAQDSRFELKGVHFKYTKEGFVKEVHNRKRDLVQYVR